VDGEMSISTSRLRVLRSSPRLSGGPLLSIVAMCDVKTDRLAAMVSSKGLSVSSARQLFDVSINACCISPKDGMLESRSHQSMIDGSSLIILKEEKDQRNTSCWYNNVCLVVDS
jgi:hypothetical protein